MAITINDNASLNLGNALHEAIGAKLAKNQQEAEGQMALQLIESASTQNLPLTTGSVGSQVNIKA